MAFCARLPERAGVVAIPAQVFYEDGSEHGRHLVRWAFCKEQDGPRGGHPAGCGAADLQPALSLSPGLGLPGRPGGDRRRRLPAGGWSCCGSCGGAAATGSCGGPGPAGPTVAWLRTRRRAGAYRLNGAAGRTADTVARRWSSSATGKAMLRSTTSADGRRCTAEQTSVTAASCAGAR